MLYLQAPDREDGIVKRHHEVAYMRSLEILYADQAPDLGAEPSLVGAFVFAAALSIDEDQLFVTEERVLKWSFEALAGCVGLNARNIKKSLYNAHIYHGSGKEHRVFRGPVTGVVQLRPARHLTNLHDKLVAFVRTHDIPIYYPAVGLRQALRAEERAVFRQALLLPLDNRRVLARVAAKKEDPPRGFQEGLCKTILGWHQDRRRQLVKLLV